MTARGLLLKLHLILGATAAIFLVSGRFRIDLPDRSVVLDRPGAYVVFTGVGHSWEAEEDATTLVVRWPSVPGY